MRKSLIIISIIFSSVVLRASYTVDSALIFADEQYLKGNYKLALKEYQRISFHTDYSDPFFQLRLANCYYKNGEWATARNYYDQIFRITQQDTLLVEAKLKKISSLIVEDQYKLALIDLFGLPDTTYQKYDQEFNLLFAICYYGLEDFEESKRYFQVMVAESVSAQEEIELLFANKKLMERPKPNVAYILSIVLPGLGQTYSGNVGDGLNSFVLTESFVILAFFIAYEYTIVDAILSALPWYQRYFLGGLDNAKEMALIERKKRRSQVYKSVLDVVVTN